MKYTLFFIIGFIGWIAETAFFGFNEQALSFAERAADLLTWTLMFWGIIGDLTSNLKIEKSTNITAEKVVVNQLSSQTNSKESK